MNLKREPLVDIINGTCDGKHHYGWDAKPNPADAPNTWTLADCSGLMVYTLKRAWGINVLGGSVDIHTWCEKKVLKQVKYSVVAPLSDSIVRLCFIEPKGGEPGHVWLCVNGQSFESHGRDNGKDGPDRRPWNEAVLLHNVSACFELGPLS